MPLLKSYIEFAGIHSDLFFASEGTASPNSTSAPMTGRLRQVGFRAAGAAALIPSSAQKRSGSSSRSFKAIFKRGMLHTLRMIPDAECTAPLFIPLPGTGQLFILLFSQDVILHLPIKQGGVALNEGFQILSQCFTPPLNCVVFFSFAQAVPQDEKFLGFGGLKKACSSQAAPRDGRFFLSGGLQHVCL